MRKSHRRPRNEQDFEELCLRLLQAHWKCPELELYAARGQAQFGVDIIDLGGGVPLRAAQCKLHEEGKIATPGEVKAEVRKARHFQPPLDRFLIMTTAKAGREIHDLLIAVNRKHKREELFAVHVFDWRRIEGLLDMYPEVRASYEGSPALGELGPLVSGMEQSRPLSEMRSIDLDNYRNDQNHAEIDEAREYLRAHDYQLAKLLLHRIKERKWGELNPRHKFRVLSNLATVELTGANPRGAADLYLKAKKHQPEEEVAQTHEAFAYLLLDQRDRAFERATELRRRFPRSPQVIAIYIKSAPDCRVLKSVEKEVPKDLLEDDQVAGALAERTLDDGDLQSAEKFARIGIAAGGREPGLLLLFGRIVLQSEVLGSRRRYGETLSCDAERVSEAEEALTRALVLAKERRSTPETLDALLTRRLARLILKKDGEARQDLSEAVRIGPEDPLVLEARAEWLSSEGNPDEAIESMLRIAPQAMSPQGHLLLAVLLLERGDAGDFNRAADLATEAATRDQDLHEGLREDCIEVAFQAFAKAENIEPCHEVLARLPKGAISEMSRLTLTARLRLLQGHQEEAARYANDALALAEESTTAFDLRRLSTLLSTLGQYATALPLWQRIVVPSVLSSDTKHLLECASHLGNHGLMLEIFRSLRNSGQSDQELLDHEIDLLRRYDTDGVIELLNAEIVRRPQDRDLKLKRSYLGLSLDRDDLVDKDRDHVPPSSVVKPATALKAVHVLQAIGEGDFAVRYAYEVVRRNFRAPDAHRALMVALGLYGRETKVEKPSAVGVDTAVCYLERGDSTPRWIIIERCPDRGSELPEKEVGPEDDICKQMMGKRVGDTFVLARGIQQRMAEIRGYPAQICL